MTTKHSTAETSDQHKSKCQSIYYNLLLAQNNSYNTCIPSTAFVRELYETQKCDDIIDFSRYRAEYEYDINRTDKTRMERIMNYKETQEDEKYATQVRFFYRKRNKSALLTSLSLSDWLYFHIFENT